MHQLLSVYWNGSFLDSVAIAQALSGLRLVFKGWQPLLQPLASPASPALTLFNQVRDEILHQQWSAASSPNTTLAPLFVALPTDKAKWIPVDEYALNRSLPFPPPGSSAWPSYAIRHQAATYFVNTIIPALANNGDAVETATLFHPDARLMTLDGSLLLEGASRVANFYASLATLRRGTLGSWTVEGAAASARESGAADEATGAVQVSVDYGTIVNVPGAAPTTVRGMDVFVVSSSASGNSAIVIKEVQQKELSIGENSSLNYGVFVMRSVATAIATSTGRVPFAGGFWLDLLRRAAQPSGIRELVDRSDDSKLKERVFQPKPRKFRSDRAGLTAYRVIEALHHECTNIMPTDGGEPNLPPASRYMVESVQLNGYMGEVLLRGRSNYNQIFTLALASISATLRSGRVQSKKEPLVRIELTSQGNVICSLTLFFKLSSLSMARIPGFDSKPAGKASPTLPTLKIGFLSEYVLCPETGRILQHRLLESRVNGQLTPGDVVSRLIQRRSGRSTTDVDSDSKSAAVDWLQILQDSVEWVRSSMNTNPP